MAKTHSSYISFLAICAIAMFFALASGARAAELDWASLSAAVAGGGFVGVEEEFALDSESNRRILATTSYISYGALQRNTIPCSRRGASYYNCRPGAQSNPYSRGCSTITRCRS